jgi:hypothetical protein
MEGLRVTVSFDDEVSQDILRYCEWVGISPEKFVQFSVETKMRMFKEQKLKFAYFDEDNNREVLVKEPGESIPQMPQSMVEQ